MDIIRIRMLALLGAVTLSLLSGFALAGEETNPYDMSDSGVLPADGQLKASKDCPDTTHFFKNVIPFNANGTSGGTASEVFSIDGEDVTVTVDWYADNTFDFTVDGGYAYKVAVTVGTNNFVYDYSDSPVIADSGLNRLTGVAIAADVNHLDLCLAAADTIAPVIVITSPSDSGTVSGTVTVTATVTDNEGLSLVTASVTGGSLTGPVSLDPPTFTAPDQYSWTWDTAGLEPGLYTLTVGATDTEVVVPNTTTVSIDVELVNSAATCAGFRNDDDPTQDEGCNYTGIVNIQLPPVNNFNDGPDGCTALVGEVCQITGFQLKPDPLVVATLAAEGCQSCNVCPADTFPDTRMSFINGGWVPTEFRPLQVFGELGLSEDSTQYPDDALVLNEYTFGFPCIVAAKHNKNFSLTQGFAFWPNTDDPGTVDDNEATGVVFIATHFPEEVLSPELRPKCYSVDGNYDLQVASQAGYQTTDRSLMFGATAQVLTDRCFNPVRNMERNKSFQVSGIVEHGGIDFETESGPYEVLEFKFQMAEMAFDALFFAIYNADAAVDDLGASCLRFGKIADVTKRANQARSQFNKFNDASLTRAIDDLTALVDVVSSQQDWCVIEENFAGDILAQAYALIWRIEQIRAELNRLESL